MKSSQFQGSLRYVCGSNINPLPITLTIHSILYMAKNRYLKRKEKCIISNELSPLKNLISIIREWAGFITFFF